MVSETKQFEKKVKTFLKDYFQNLGEKVKVKNQWVPFRGETVELEPMSFCGKNEIVQITSNRGK